jgi:epoxyqueuosine reductase
MSLNAEAVKAKALELGFDLCGIAAATAHAELAFLDEWLARGYAGEMDYLACSADRRRDVRHVLPSAQSVIVTGTVYNTDRPYSIDVEDPAIAKISRYAWGDDYHDVIAGRLDRLVDWMRSAHAEPFEAKAYVDTGPVQERVFAQHAGLGWIGKNTCLISFKRGSWLFLSVIVCSLALDVDEPVTDHCGTCTQCLDACPTGAIVEPWVLDSRRCLSYLTIELRGPVPDEFHALMGSHVYGCDICQDVCPWNRMPLVSHDPAWQPRRAFDGVSLSELAGRSDEELRADLIRSPMKRTKIAGLRRNVAIALANREQLTGPGHEHRRRE